MTATSTYFRTTKGSHRHADFECANQRRAIDLGAPVAIPADEVANWAACEFCCSTGEVIESVKAAEAKAETMCPNYGVVAPKRIESECRTCGKHGKVNRRTGKIAAHRAA